MKTNEIGEAVKVVAEFDEEWSWSDERQVFFVTDYVAIPDKTGCRREPIWDRECSINYLKTEYLSLDRLVRVWEKLNCCSPRFSRSRDNSFNYCVIPFSIDEKSPDWDFEVEGYVKYGTIQQAALLATSKAIKLLRNERTENTGELK